MPRRSNAFQRLVLAIEKAVRPQGARVDESRELIDRTTGEKREVDIVVELQDGAGIVTVSVECTGGAGSRPETVEWVERMHGKHASLPTNKLVLVSETGFTRQATKKAAFLGHSTFSIEEAERVDWPSLVYNLKTVRLENFLLPYATAVAVVFDKNQEVGFDLASLDLENSTIQNDECGEVDRLPEFVTRCLADANLVEKLRELAFDDAATEVTVGLELRRGTYITDTDGLKRPVVSIQVTARCKKETSRLELRQGSYGDAALVYATGMTFSRPVRVVATQQQWQEPTIGVLIDRKPSGSTPPQH